MKELWLVCAVAAIFVFGYFVMKKLDAFLEKNRRCAEQKNAADSLLLAFDNPMIMDSLRPLFEKFTKINPDCRLHFLFGNTEDIYDALENNNLDFAFIKYTALEHEDTCHCLMICAEQNRIFCENTGCAIEPLQPGSIQTVVLRKRGACSAFADRFFDLLLSDQTLNNPAHVK